MDGDKLVLISGICIFTAAVCKLFDNGSREYGVMVKTAAAAVIMASVMAAIMPAVNEIKLLYSKTGGDSEYLTILMKCLGICYLTQLASDICHDSGEGTLAVQAETAGKAAMLAAALPLFEQAALLAQSLIY